MRKTLRLTVLYCEDSNPHDKDTEWREIAIKCDKWPPAADSYMIEEFSGFEKKQTKADTATVFVGSDFNQVLREYDNMIDRLEKEGFIIYDPRTWGRKQTTATGK